MGCRASFGKRPGPGSTVHCMWTRDTKLVPESAKTREGGVFVVKIIDGLVTS